MTVFDKYRVKRILTAFFATASLLAVVGCSENDEGVKPPHIDKESHLSLLGFHEGVKTVRVSDREGGVWLEAGFLPDGRCSYWNETGVERTATLATTATPATSAPQMTSAPSTRGFAVESAWYEYEYDGSSRLSAVVKHPLGGDAVRYEISYGAHTGALPSPLPVARLENYMLQGVTRIVAEGYTLTCDGRVAKAEADLGREDWGRSREVTTLFLGHGHTREAESRVLGTVGGEEQLLSSVHRFFTYADDGELSREEAVFTESGASFRVETAYMKGCGVLPVERKRFQSGSDVAESHLVMEYTPTRLPLAVRYLTGESLLAEPLMETRYLDFDTQGNWTRAEQMTDGERVELYQTLTYH